MRRDRLNYPRDGSFEMILKIFLIWTLKRVKLVFEMETGTRPALHDRPSLALETVSSVSRPSRPHLPSVPFLRR